MIEGIYRELFSHFPSARSSYLLLSSGLLVTSVISNLVKIYAVRVYLHAIISTRRPRAHHPTNISFLPNENKIIDSIGCHFVLFN